MPRGADQLHGEPGQIVFMRPDILAKLPIYGDFAVKVDEIVIKSPTSAHALYTVTSERTAPLFAPGELNTYGYSVLRVTEQHTEGHFDREKGWPSVFPGYKMVAAATQEIGGWVKDPQLAR